LDRIKKKFFCKNNNGSGMLLNNILDLLYFLTFGAILILISYSTLDGTVRIFIPFFASVSFIIVNKTIGDKASKILKFIFCTVNALILFLLELVLHYPVLTVSYLKRRVNTYISECKIKRLKKAFRKLSEKKIIDIKKIKGYKSQ
jgi:hypothetical protein